MEISKDMFYRVCGLRVQVWKSYITYRSSRYGYGSLAEELTEVPGIIVQNSQKFRAGLQVLYSYQRYCGTGI